MMPHALGMMALMGLVGVLILVALVLGVAALIKYLFGDRDR